MKNFLGKFKIIFLLVISLSLFNVALAANISTNTGEFWAWNDIIGWIDFGTPGNVVVSFSKISGYVNSAIGYVGLNCDSTPNGDICGGASGNWGVENNGGNLSGWAWNDAIGWISFTCDHTSDGTSVPYNTNVCSSYPNYGVNINATSGEFEGWAWNDVVGWISFNCNNDVIGNTCASSNYKLKTSWTSIPVSGNLESSIFDLGSGISPNSIMWKGDSNGGSVKFQVAASNGSEAGSFIFKCPNDGSTDVSSCPEASRDVPILINPNLYKNLRYFKYKVFIYSDVTQTYTPVVKDVIINYSP